MIGKIIKNHSYRNGNEILYYTAVGGGGGGGYSGSGGGGGSTGLREVVYNSYSNQNISKLNHIINKLKCEHCNSLNEISSLECRNCGSPCLIPL